MPLIRSEIMSSYYNLLAYKNPSEMTLNSAKTGLILFKIGYELKY